MIRLSVIVLMFFAPNLMAQELPSVITEIMKKQELCWNKGDLECFMNGYWESDSLMFVSKDKIYYGYQNTLERYQSTYPNKEAMGELTFKFLHMEMLGNASFYMVGQYHLKRSIGDLMGHFTLLWKKIDGVWVIVSDHSS